MAVRLNFISCEDSDDIMTLECELEKDSDSMVKGNKILIQFSHEGYEGGFAFDIPTAIKLAKTLRTEINKAKEVINE